MHIRGLVIVSVVAFVACGDDTKKKADTTSDAADTVDATDTADVAPDAVDDATSPDVAPDAVDDATADSADTTTPVDADAVFVFRAAQGQSISEGPFPNDGLIGADGLIKLAPLGADARFGTLAKPTILTRTDTQIAARKGFGFVSSAFFPMNAEPDLASFEGAVKYVALTGPEAGATFPAQVHWFQYARYLAVFPAWGHYLVPGSKYGILIAGGVKDKDGRSILAPPSFTAVMGPVPDAGDITAEVSAARAAFADLRDWLSTRDETAVIGTVFTTEATMPYVEDLFAAVDAFQLVTPTRNVRYDAASGWQAADVQTPVRLSSYFAIPFEPFLYMPTGFESGTRDLAKSLPAAAGGTGERYLGGAFHGAVGYVVNGTMVMPVFNQDVTDGKVTSTGVKYVDGKPVPRQRAAVPFSVFICSYHLGPNGEPDPARSLPFAIFTHGGTAIRSDALPYAVANCAAGFSTVAIDLPFHGGRQETTYVAADDLIAPTRVDNENVYSGTKAGDEAFVPDGIGDNGDATVTVGGMFGLASDFDPDVIEANQIAIATDAHTLVRYLKDGGPNGLGALLGTKINASHLVMESLSFGTSFTSALMAGSDDFVGAVQSVGSGGMISLNLPMAPNNALLAGGIIRTIYQLKSSLDEINAGAQYDPMIMMLQWLCQKGDPAGYAPFVLRHRSDDHTMAVYGSGDSWDETLFSPAQLSFNNAWGVPVFEAGAAWTLDASIPGADTVAATALGDNVADNLTFDGRTQSAGYFYNAAACHAESITPICRSSYQPPYPPATERATPLVTASPICALQKAVIPFLNTVLGGESPTIEAPGAGSCEELYAP